MSLSSSNYENNISSDEKVVDLNITNTNKHTINMELTELEVCLITKFRSLNGERQQLLCRTALMLNGDDF